MKISVLLIFLLSRITQKLYGVCKHTYQTIALLMKIILACLELHVNYDLLATASKLSPECNATLSHLDNGHSGVHN